MTINYNVIYVTVLQKDFTAWKFYLNSLIYVTCRHANQEIC